MKIENKDMAVYPDRWDAALTGLNKREYFAALAMQGYCSTGNYANGQDIAKDAVCAADALLEELAK